MNTMTPDRNLFTGSTMRAFTWALLAGAAAAWPAALQAGQPKHAPQYKVTITNITRGQSFTPILVASHRPGVSIFSVGEVATSDLAALAEGGATDDLQAALDADPLVRGTGTSSGLLDPGKSVSVMVPAWGGANRISLAAMLLPTNDGFIGLNGAAAPRGRSRSTTYMVPGYDAGTEPNDEDCLSIPGPVCGGQGGSPDADGEGYVHIHAGIHGSDSLAAAAYDWRNPVARVVIERVR